MVIVLLGKTASGKTSISDFLHREYKWKQWITVTTRPPRVNESQGNPYFFVSNKAFKHLIDNDNLIEYKSYTVANGDVWYYGCPKISVEQAKAENIVLILTPAGLHDAKKYFEENEIPFKSVYIAASESTRRMRLHSRGDEPEEVSRRIAADEKDFKDIEDLIDVTITNNNGSVAYPAVRIKCLASGGRI
ncbi:guanylate kinase [Lachnospiraceae bacterium KHCPX20]|nr:guanylate kinase [Lachnospiraceae bacterium KHCPX20]